MTKLINMKGAVALAMALSFCVYSVAPTLDNSTIVSEPITSYEAQSIEGGLLPIAAAVAASPLIIKVVVAVATIDAVLIVGAWALYGNLAK